MIIDGKQIAADILARTKARAAKLSHRPKVVAIVGEETPATRSYLKIKERAAVEAGCAFETRALGSDYSDADAVIVQLPLPAGSDQKEILDAIPSEKDADVLSAFSRLQFENDELDTLVPPVAGAVAEILKAGKVDVKEKRAVVIGSGWLVGAPVAILFAQLGADVSTITLEAGDLGMLKDADLIVSGAGSPGLIKPEMIKEGVVLIDAGTSESSGKVVGDADPACAAKCSLFTPVPGGVGPIAVAKLFENAVLLAERK